MAANACFTLITNNNDDIIAASAEDVKFLTAALGPEDNSDKVDVAVARSPAAVQQINRTLNSFAPFEKNAQSASASVSSTPRKNTDPVATPKSTSNASMARPDLPEIHGSNHETTWNNLKPVEAVSKHTTYTDKLKSVLPPTEEEYDEPVNGFIPDEKIRNAMKAAERAGPISGEEAREVLHYLYRMGGDPAVEKKLLERLVGMIEHLESQVQAVHAGATRAVAQPSNNKPLKMDTLRAHPFVVLSQAYLRTWNVAHDFEKFLGRRHKMYFSVNEQLRAYMKSIMRECTMPEHRSEFLWDELNHYFQNVQEETAVKAVPTAPVKPAPMSAREFVNGISFGAHRVPDSEDDGTNIEIEQRPYRHC